METLANSGRDAVYFITIREWKLKYTIQNKLWNKVKKAQCRGWIIQKRNNRSYFFYVENETNLFK